MRPLLISGDNLTVEIVGEVARSKESKVGLSNKAEPAIRRSRDFVERMLSAGKVVYGLTTGFGKFQDKVIPKDKVRELQVNLIRSHSVGVGDPFPESIVRAAMLIRANALAKGYSGVKVGTILKILELLNRDVYPYIPEKGSLGASGDLAPLSHLVLVLLGEGEVIHHHTRVPTAGYFKEMGITPISLDAKEGLALNNGTAFMAAIASLAYLDGINLVRHADAVASLTLEALRGNDSPFHPLVHEVRPHKGQQDTARFIRMMIKGSKLINSISSKVQDAYSLRCVPQVHGTVRDTLAYVKRIIATEINSATDNPLIFTEQELVISAGNFHGAPLAAILDFLAISLTDLASISERRIAKLVDPANNEGLPAFLVSPQRVGLDSGFMLMQYTAAALVAESKILSHPASVDSIPTSANQEDHVSMGMNAALKLRIIIENVTNVLAIEFLTAVQALDFRGKAKKGQGTEKVYKVLRRQIPRVTKDRIFYPEIKQIADFIKSQKFTKGLNV